MKNTRTLVLASLFVVMEVILTQYLGLTLPTMRFTLTFVVMGVAGYLMGPWMGAGIAGLADLIGMLLWPKGPFNIGFTLAAVCSGFLFGLFHKKEGKNLILWIVIATVLNTLISNVLIRSYALTLIQELPIEAFIIPRLIKAVAELPIRIAILIPMIKAIERLKPRLGF